MPPRILQKDAMAVEHLKALDRINNPGVPNTPVAPNMGLYAIKNLPGRNKGFQALRDIPKGTLILAEEALFSVDNVHHDLTNDNERDIIAQAETHSEKFKNLYCPSTRLRKGQASLKRFVANNFQMDGDTDGPCKQGIFLEASRLNHSCIPNALFEFNDEVDPHGHLTVYAIHDIRLGQEIVVNYRQRDCYKPRRERQRELQEGYKFTCTCPACEPNTPFGRGSEGRRSEMATLEARINQYQNSDVRREREQRRKDIEDLIELLKEEEIRYPQLALNHRRLAECWNEKWLQTGSGATDARRTCSTAALKAARDKPDLDLICIGSGSPGIWATLTWLIGLECRSQI